MSSSSSTTATTSRSPRPACGSSTARTSCALTVPGRGSRSSSTRSGSMPSASWSRRNSRASGLPSATSRWTGSSWSTTRRATRPRREPTYASANGDQRDFDRFLDSNVARQRQPGFFTVEVKVVRGDLTPEQLRGLGEVMRRYSGGYARTTVHQNLVLRWVREESVYEVWQALSELDLGEAGADEISDGSAARAPTPASSASPARWGSTGHPGAHRRDEHRRSAHAPDPRQEQRLPQRLRTASHRRHRVLRRLDQGWRAHHPGLHSARRGRVRGRRGPLRPAAQGASARQARA